MAQKRSYSETPSVAMKVQDASVSSGNNPVRAHWFSRLGLGLFIHWSLDSQLGAVISHSMVGASPDYLSRFIHDLPKTFKPTRFDPDEWARLAKVLPKETHRMVGKESGQTNHMERWNCTLRQRLARFVRKTLSFSKSDVIHQVVLKCFITDYNLTCVSQL
jgi:IS1 family transposase